MIKLRDKAWVIELVASGFELDWPFLEYDRETVLPKFFRTQKAAKAYAKLNMGTRDKLWKLKFRRVTVTTESI